MLNQGLGCWGVDVCAVSCAKIQNPAIKSNNKFLLALARVPKSFPDRIRDGLMHGRISSGFVEDLLLAMRVKALASSARDSSSSHSTGNDNAPAALHCRVRRLLHRFPVVFSEETLEKKKYELHRSRQMS